MCGINGFTFKDEQLIREMNQTIKYRGPDDDGLYTDEHVTLGHVRLSILDLTAAGHQPMASPDQNLWIVFNGEIYNFLSLKQDLVKKGHTFVSDSDTEVLVAGFAEYGTSLFAKLNGIFAFCIYDKKEQCLYLVRDSLGIKPLYYFQKNKQLYFSSDPRAFLRVMDFSGTLNHSYVDEYLHSFNITKETFFSEIQSVIPGQYLKIGLENLDISVHMYRSITSLVSKSSYQRNLTKSELQLTDELDQMLNDVVKDQMVSDAPLGTICSGGVDSSLITAVAAQYKRDIKLFNVRVDNAKCDESKFARQVAEHLQVELIEDLLDQERYLELYKQCIESEGLPLTHSNSVGIFLVSKKAKNAGISVLLSGEGADELFGGYHIYKSFCKRLLISNIPIPNSILVKSVSLFTNLELLGGTRIDKKILANNIGRFPWLRERFNLIGEFDEAYAFIDKSSERHLKSFIAKDLQYYLPPVLRRADRMSMAVGLEMRVPYLDNRLVEFALNLPAKYQTNHAEVKILLKKVAERYLPMDIVHREKKGFPLPINEWLSTSNYRTKMFEDWKQIYQV